MKKTLIELAKEAGFEVENGGVFAIYGFSMLNDKLTKFAELLQANSGNTVDVSFVTDEHLKDLARFKETTEDDSSYDLPKIKMISLAKAGLVAHTSRGIYMITDFGLAMLKVGSASLANKPELRVYIEHDFVCVRTETGQLVDSKKLSDFKSNEFLAITKG